MKDNNKYNILLKEKKIIKCNYYKITIFIAIMIFNFSICSYADTNKISVTQNPNNSITLSSKLNQFQPGSIVGYKIFEKNKPQTALNLISIDDAKISKNGSISFENINVLGNRNLIVLDVMVNVGDDYYNFQKVVIKADGENISDLIAEMNYLPTDDKVLFISQLASIAGVNMDSDSIYSALVEKDGIDILNGKVLSKLANIQTKMEFKKMYQREVMLTFVSKAFGSEIMKYLVNEYDIINNSLFDKEKYEKLSYVEKEKVFTSVAGKTYGSEEEIIEAMNSEISSYNTKSPINGGGGNRGGGNKGNNTIELPKNQNQNGGEALAFSDINDALWAKDYISALVKKGVISGYSDNTFRPNNSITRAEFLKMATAELNLEANTEALPFTDVLETDWYYTIIKKAYDNGIVHGSDDLYEPNSLVTRQDVAVILYRIHKNILKQPLEEHIFLDNNEIFPYATQSIQNLYFNKVINGYSDNAFKPLGNATRSEVAKMIFNIMTIMEVTNGN